MDSCDLGSALLTERWKERNQVRDSKRAIAVELREVAYRLLGIIYITELRFGNFDRKLLEWMRPQIEKYAGPNPRESVLSGVSELLTRTDAEFAQIVAYERAIARSGQSQPRRSDKVRTKLTQECLYFSNLQGRSEPSILGAI